MIKYNQIQKMFDDASIEVHEYRVELLNQELSIPFLVYSATYSDSFVADGVNYFNSLSVNLTLIDETLNFEMQRAVEKVLSDNWLSFDKAINFDDDERLYSISYTFTVLDDTEAEDETESQD